MSKDKFSFYKEYPKTCAPDDFWGQVKRTVNGVPVSQDQIDMIVDAVVSELELSKEDCLLDLCCGNGALSTLLFEYCSGGLGVDFSEHLISVANNNFSAPPSKDYILQDVVEFCENPITPHKFSKLVCYGSFSYIEQDKAVKLLHLLKSNFPNLRRIFIGNCPDKVLLPDFFAKREAVPGIENNPDSPIGVWRTQAEFISLAKRCGWEAAIHKMPVQYYSSHYRYDVVLSHE
jgi:SAM-dependent methyltransferase